ncbi:MAG: hypothetical protein M9955_10070 [Rhizobiaceae bacterium]|nr:hypothetical protein [Rhizobiaceae bacterium]
MTADMNAWGKVVREAVAGLADEAVQRRSWFGLGPEVSSPDEAFNQFFGDAAIEEFLKLPENGLNQQQHDACAALVEMMETLSKYTPQSISSDTLIDDPRWVAIRAQAAQVSRLLSLEQRP